MLCCFSDHGTVYARVLANRDDKSE